MPKTVVWNQLGVTVGETISSAVPEVEVVNIEKDPRQIPEPKGSVLFATLCRDVPREALPFVDVSWAAGVESVHAADRDRPISSGTFRKQDCYLWPWPLRLGDRGLRFGSGPRLREATAGDPVGVSGAGRSDGPRPTRGQDPWGIWARRDRPGGRSPCPCIRDGSRSDVPDGEAQRYRWRDDSWARRAPGGRQTTSYSPPSTDLTVHLLDVGRLQKVKRGVHVVNVARGTLVDNDALVDALERGHVSRATLDVTKPEPLPRDDPLRRHPLARVSDHVSGRVAGVGDRLVGLFVDNLRRVLAGQPLLGVVDWGSGTRSTSSSPLT